MKNKYSKCKSPWMGHVCLQIFFFASVCKSNSTTAFLICMQHIKKLSAGSHCPFKGFYIYYLVHTMRVVQHFARNPKTLKEKLGSLFILKSVWLLWLKRGFPTQGRYVTIAHGGTEDTCKWHVLSSKCKSPWMGHVCLQIYFFNLHARATHTTSRST